MENTTALKSENELKNKPLSPVKEMVLNGLLIAMVFVATYVIQIKLPISLNGGLIHMGNVALFTIAIVLGKKRGAVSGAFGMALFDIMSSWQTWAPFTFVVRGVMGFIIGFFAQVGIATGKRTIFNLLGIIVGGTWMLFGYYMTEVILYGNWTAPMASIPGNLTQIGIGLVLALPISAALGRVSKEVGRS